MIKIYEYKEYEDKIESIFINKNSNENSKIVDVVDEILHDIIKRGDRALFSYTKKFDKVVLTKDNVKVTSEEIDEAYKRADKKLIDIIKKASDNISEFHEKQKEKDFYFNKGKNSKLGQRITPIEKVGVYVPGGTAPLPSSVLMNVIPAKIAGVDRVVMVTPPKKQGISDIILVAAKIAGVDEIYKVGGAQAICALATGTCSIPKVDKIVGPGNIFVATAKKLVFGMCDIDMIAGPSEICIVADESANVEYIAADMLSQAEHDVLSSSVLITMDIKIANEVIEAIKRQIKDLKRIDIAKKALEDNGKIIVVNNMKEAQNTANIMAPEHLELMIENAWEKKDNFINAGAIFIGQYSPEPLGDYMAGSNHVLPTSKTARFFSPLGVYDFIKRTSIIKYSKEDLDEVNEDINIFALSEGLDAHANSVRIRKERKL